MAAISAARAEKTLRAYFGSNATATVRNEWTGSRYARTLRVRVGGAVASQAVHERLGYGRLVKAAAKMVRGARTAAIGRPSDALPSPIDREIYDRRLKAIRDHNSRKGQYGGAYTEEE